MANSMKVFLGGTCAGSIWRDKLIPILEDPYYDVKYFNPVVKDWTYKDKMNEYKQKDICNIHLYVITKEMKGVFSIAEAVDSVWRYDKKCVFVVISEGFDKGEILSLNAVGELIQKRGGCWKNYNSFDRDASYEISNILKSYFTNPLII